MTLAPMPFTTTRRVNLDTLIDAYERRPDTKQRKAAWEWLSEAEVFHFDGDQLIVPSATWDGTTYRTSPTSCTCRRGRANCWHKEAAGIVAEALAEDAAIDFAAVFDTLAIAQVEPKRVRYAASLADVMELFN